MDQRDPRLARWSTMITALSAEHGWALSGEEVERYLLALDRLLPATCTVADLHQVCNHYHTDHRQVETLCKHDHPDHSAGWLAWLGQATEILHKAGLHWSSDSAVHCDDLVQVAQMALVVSLPNFAYRSSFTTWAYTVVVQSVRRHIRDSCAKKRAQRPASLDAAPELAVPAAEADEPEQQAATSLLIDQIRTILIQGGDERLALIFHLWAVDDLATEVIGKRIHLHPSRVRALLVQARTLLQRHPTIRTWLADLDTVSRV